MGSITANILIGNSHTYHGGINPSHFIFLFENSRPCWVLVPQNIFKDELNNSTSEIKWIPTVDNMLEDAILMIAVHVLKDEETIKLMQQCSGKENLEQVELYDIDADKLKELYEKCYSLDYECKIALSIYEGSTIAGQIKCLDKYKMEKEVCIPISKK